MGRTDTSFSGFDFLINKLNVIAHFMSHFSVLVQENYERVFDWKQIL